MNDLRSTTCGETRYNQDGKLDVAVANSFIDPITGESSNQGSVSILKGNSKGSFAEPRKFAFSRPVIFDVGDGPLAVVSKPDLTLTNSGNKDTSTLNTLYEQEEDQAESIPDSGPHSRGGLAGPFQLPVSHRADLLS